MNHYHHFSSASVLYFHDVFFPDGLVLEKTFQHHKRWANSVKWSPTNEYHFASGGFDNVVKLWDIRRYILFMNYKLSSILLVAYYSLVKFSMGPVLLSI